MPQTLLTQVRITQPTSTPGQVAAVTHPALLLLPMADELATMPELLMPAEELTMPELLMPADEERGPDELTGITEELLTMMDVLLEPAEDARLEAPEEAPLLPEDSP